MRAIKAGSTVLVRFFLSLLFLASGVNKIFHWHETERTLTSILTDWQAYADYFPNLQELLATLVPWSPLLLILATLLELIGGLLLLLGVRERMGAGLLIAFLLPTTILCHQFWFVEGAERDLQQIMFLKNLAIIGGLVMVMLHGTQLPAKESNHGFSGASLRLP
ncbi:MAG: DoxX family protein [Verrucomicrobiota bacterium]|nr:DoxX family protein [Verrucomicrobiota bacterium]